MLFTVTTFLLYKKEEHRMDPECLCARASLYHAMGGNKLAKTRQVVAATNWQRQDRLSRRPKRSFKFNRVLQPCSQDKKLREEEEETTTACILRLSSRLYNSA